MKCKIQWVNTTGPTPDQNDAIGYVYRVAYTQQRADGVSTFPETERFPICADHARQLDQPNMAYWRFEPLDGGTR
jgi:hypothetical protein